MLEVDFVAEEFAGARVRAQGVKRGRDDRGGHLLVVEDGDGGDGDEGDEYGHGAAPLEGHLAKVGQLTVGAACHEGAVASFWGWGHPSSLEAFCEWRWDASGAGAGCGLLVERGDDAPLY